MSIKLYAIICSNQSFMPRQKDYLSASDTFASEKFYYPLLHGREISSKFVLKK